MSVTLVSNSIKEYTADIFVEIINLKNKKSDVYDEICDDCLMESMPWGHFILTAKNAPFPCYISTVTGGKYKCMWHIGVVDNNICSNEYSKVISTYDNMFYYMKHCQLKTVALSLMQFKSAVGADIDFVSFIREMVDNSYFYDVDIIIYIDKELQDKSIKQIKKIYGKNFLKQVKKGDWVIFDKEYFESEKNIKQRKDYEDNEFELKLEKYIEKHIEKNGFIKLLNKYLQRTDYSDVEMDRRAELPETTFNKIKNEQIPLNSNRVLAIGIALELDMDELKEFMRAAGFIFPRDDGSNTARRDWCIKYLIEEYDMRNVGDINRVLEMKGLEILGKKSKALDYKIKLPYMSRIIEKHPYQDEFDDMYKTIDYIYDEYDDYISDNYISDKIKKMKASKVNVE